jgi:hypothetical protein
MNGKRYVTVQFISESLQIIFSYRVPLDNPVPSIC